MAPPKADLESRRQRDEQAERLRQEVAAEQARQRREALEEELEMQTRMREDTTAVMGQELLSEWQHQVHSLRGENDELRRSLGVSEPARSFSTIGLLLDGWIDGLMDR